MNSINTRSKSANNCDSQASARNKRNRNSSPEASPEITNAKNAKKIKKSKMTSKDIDELKSLITLITPAIEKKICDSHQILESKINELGNKVNTEIHLLKSSVDDFKSEVGRDMNVMKVQLSEHAQLLENTDDDFDRIKLHQDLRIAGIIFKDNENLIEIFKKIAAEIGFNIEQCTPTLERIAIRNRTTGQMIPSNTIIIHFAIQRQK